MEGIGQDVQQHHESNQALAMGSFSMSWEEEVISHDQILNPWSEELLAKPVP